MQFESLPRNWRQYMKVIETGANYYQLIDRSGCCPTTMNRFLRLAIHRGLVDEKFHVRLYMADYMSETHSKMSASTTIYLGTRKRIIMKGDAEFQRAVVERDGKCVRCGKFGLRNDKDQIENLSAHHLVRRKYLRTRHDPRNGVTLCIACHEWAHKHPDNDRWLASERPDAEFDPLGWYEYRKQQAHSSVIKGEM
jgi:hypothetical protein